MSSISASFLSVWCVAADFIPQLAVERFDVPILPRAARLASLRLAADSLTDSRA